LTFFRRRARHRADHEKTSRVLARHEKDIVDMAARLLRLEAEVGIYRPFVIRDHDTAQ
jgi:hypothetical protein